MKIARSIGINWIGYIHYHIIDSETVIIDKEYRLHKFDDNDHPIVTTKKEYRIDSLNSDVPILTLDFGIKKEEYLVLKPKSLSFSNQNEEFA